MKEQERVDMNKPTYTLSICLDPRNVGTNVMNYQPPIDANYYKLRTIITGYGVASASG